MNKIPHFWKHDLEQIEQKTGYCFKEKDLLVEAFTHCSYANENNLPFNSERLEFLGDAVLDLIATEYLFIQFTYLEEGDLTFIRSNIVDAKACYKYSFSMDIEQHLLLGKGERINGGAGRNTILADLFEALVGAIYLDAGLEHTKTFVIPHIISAVEQSIMEPSHNWKAKLQEFSQKVFKTSPIYKVLSEDGPDHKKEYTCGVFINENHLGTGIGQSKKEAQQKAAQEAIETLEKQQNIKH